MNIHTPTIINILGEDKYQRLLDDRRNLKKNTLGEIENTIKALEEIWKSMNF